jgi:hypothetical protein
MNKIYTDFFRSMQFTIMLKIKRTNIKYIHMDKKTNTILVTEGAGFIECLKLLKK